MDELLELAGSNDPVNNIIVMHGIDTLLANWHQSGKKLTSDESILLVGLCSDLLKDSNSTVSQGALHALASIAMLFDSYNSRTDEHVMARLDGLTPMVLARLGDESQLVRDGSRRFLVSLMELKEKNAKADKLEANNSNSLPDLNLRHVNVKTAKNSNVNIAKTTPKPSLIAGQNENTNKSIEPIKLNSEKELSREIEIIRYNLTPDKDWSTRIATMQRLEALILGGCVEYKSFGGLMTKQLVTPFITQLLDRRSTVVKQVCHVLNLLSKELRRDFEPCAELFIPVLFKLVVITIQVIAESADSCIKTLLLNCKVAKVLPRIIDCAKNDRSAVLRARCCEYAVLMLERWVDSSEIQKSFDLYQDLITCCIEDATSEVRSTARACFRLFTKIWPERSIRLFESFDPPRQKAINDEESDLNKKSDLNSHENGHENHDEICEVINAEEDDLTSKEYQNDDIIGVEKISEDNPASRDFSMDDNKKENNSEFNENNIFDSNKEDEKSEQQSIDGMNPFISLDPEIIPNSDNSLSSNNSNNSDKTTIITINQDNNSSELSNLPLPKSTSNEEIPNFQRPLLRNQMTNWFLSKSKNNSENQKLKLGEMPGYIDVPSSLNEALIQGLNPKSQSDWSMRVFIFNFLKSLLHHGPKGIQEITLNFDKVMKLFFQHLDDPHYKVSLASLSTLEEIIPIFKRLIESYLKRILPRVFSRLNDPKELIKEKASNILKIISQNYGIDSFLPGLLRSLDEQKSPRAKLEIINFAKSNFAKCTVNSENYLGGITSNNNFVKLWIGKLIPLYKDKNSRLKQAVMNGILIIYSNYDPAIVLSFIVGISIEEQKVLRKGLKEINPKFEVDLVNFQKEKKQRQRPVQYFDRFGLIEPSFQIKPIDLGSKITEKHLRTGLNGSINSEGLNIKMPKVVTCLSVEESTINKILDQVCNGNKKGSKEAMNRLAQISKNRDHSFWEKYSEQISYASVEMMDDADQSVRELAFSLIIEMMDKKNDAMEEHLEIFVVKIIHATKDSRMNIVNQARLCLDVVTTQYDPLRCLVSIRPLLVCKDDKLLIVCINSLAKIVSRFSEEQLMAQLSSFVPSLLDAFGDRSPFIRKTVLLCLVEIYIKLGNSFLPYLERLDAMQLRLVTTYASRLSHPQ